MLSPGVLAFIGTIAAASSAPQCRCTISNPCWSAVPWGILNASVGGRLIATSDPLAPCIANLSSLACAAALNATDNEFDVTGTPDGFTRTGLFGTWNLTTVQSAYALLAESEADISAGIAFAAAHNLRVTVKGTGHGECWWGGGVGIGVVVCVYVCIGVGGCRRGFMRRHGFPGGGA